MLVFFLGILLKGKDHTLIVPQEKKDKVIDTLLHVMDRKKVTVKTIQKLTGLLNFLQRVVVLGWTFTQHMYDKL